MNQSTTYLHTRCGQRTTAPTATAKEIRAGKVKEVPCIGCGGANVPASETVWVNLDGQATTERLAEPQVEVPENVDAGGPTSPVVDPAPDAIGIEDGPTDGHAVSRRRDRR